MKRHAVVEKAVGETPLQALEAFRARTGIPRSVPITYAGRLDPMASGKLLLLIGEECKKKASYLALDKEYEFEVLFGLASDTGDVLGMPSRTSHVSVAHEDVSSVARSLRGPLTLAYPLYSSRTVGGVPLFRLTRSGASVAPPRITTTIHSMRCLSTRSLNTDELRGAVRAKLSLLQGGDFRQDEIAARWSEVLTDGGTFAIAKMRTICSSGTYIRSLAPLLGAKLGTIALAYSIHRSKIGRYHRMLGIGWWGKRY